MSQLNPEQKHLLRIYQQLYDCYGPQNWWPAETPFEVMVGAILTQNTNWHNVEKAIAQLRQSENLNAEKIVNLDTNNLAELIKPSGYYNVKARRLQNLSQWYVSAGGFDQLKNNSIALLRKSLLQINGVGPETADDILLYAFNLPVFVIDTYTRRLFTSLKFIRGDEPYEVLRSWFEASLPGDASLFNEYHALIVRHAKERRCNELNSMPYSYLERENNSII